MPTATRGEREARRDAREPRSPTAASATPTGISHASERRSETAPNDRLDDRGADGDAQQQGADRAEGIAALGDQERDQRGDRALAEIRDRVA